MTIHFSTTEANQALPFNQHKKDLYTRDQLWNGYDSDPAFNQSFDWKIFEYFRNSKKYNPSLSELVAQRSHDSGMDFAIRNHFKADLLGVPTNKKVVVIMGSHSKYRNDYWYRKIALLAYKLTKSGYFIVTGGGPGLMEAAHLGAYMAKYELKDLNHALSILEETSIPSKASKKKQYEMLDYWKKSKEVLSKYPEGAESLGIPTWFYGHEGANAFSSHVAKYFSNALREEMICAIGIHGTIFAPGGPGTLQEAAMDAAQNGYISYNWYSPMIFYSDLPSSSTMISLIKETTSPKYRELDMILKTTKADLVLDFLKRNPPVKKE